MNNEQNAISIEEILNKDKYIIPIYQRNYEWEKEQISRLIEDIDNISDNENYYLGTLVTFKRKDEKYELIDGQQRHTTLNLIKAFLNKKNEKFNLEFQARPECERFFSQLTNGIETLYENERSKNLENGINIIKDVFKENKILEVDFEKKFLKQTYIFRTELPENTDLNHYFEIMNNRGEQLEKHEILKAQLMGVFGDDKTKDQVFSKIWDACAYMGDYVWNNLDKSKAKQLFEKTDFTFEILIDIFKTEKESNYQDLKSIIAERNSLPENFSQDEQGKTDKYHSIMDFSTFLMYVYNLLCPDDLENNNSYDDKKLLEIFKNYNDSEKFIIELLKNRLYFDQYIIKNDLSNINESKWGIRSFFFENEEIKTTESLFNENEEKIEMLQAMFYYTTVSNNKKDWVINLLKNKPKSEEELYKTLEEELKNNIKNIDISTLNYPDVSSKIFYYFEFMLWEIYKDYVQGENDKKQINNELESLKSKISKCKDLFNNYRFRQLNSKEHLLSQNKFSTFKKELNLEDNDLDSFANLCLISTSENSSASNDNHYEKKSRFGNSNISLKRLMIFESFMDKNWNKECMLSHQNEMQKLLNYYRN